MSDLQRPVPVILDTDMGNDIDDALALAMLHTLADLGECRLLAVAVSKDNPYAAAYVDVVNTFYGRGAIPIGRVRGGPTPDDGRFTRAVVEARGAAGGARYPRTAASLDAYPEAVALLRRQLADAADASVTIVMIGFSTNMDRLLRSGPDACSGLDGRALVVRKVSRVVMMAADFSPAGLADPGVQNPEYNVRHDIAAAQRFVAACPAPIVFAGWEVGAKVEFPGDAIERDFGWADPHPVVDGYRRYGTMPYDRPSWDQAAVLYAVRPGAGYFEHSPPGRVVVDDTGRVDLKPDRFGPHRYLVLPQRRVAPVRDAIVRLCVQAPRQHVSPAVVLRQPRVSPPTPPLAVGAAARR